MKPCSARFAQYLQAALTGWGAQPSIADLYTITLADASVLRWTDCNLPLVVDGVTFTPGPILSRGTLRNAVDLEVGGCDLHLAGAYVMPSGARLSFMAAGGGLDGARVKIERLHMPTPGDVSLGAIYLFEGQVGELLDVGSTALTLKLVSEFEAMNIQLPRRLYQPACPYGVYDPGCSLAAATFRASLQVFGTTATTTVIPSTSVAADQHFELGWIVFTSGILAGIRRSVKSFAAGTFTLSLPLPAAPAALDAFDAFPGCDKSLAMCTTKFANQTHFGGFPNVPASDTAL